MSSSLEAAAEPPSGGGAGAEGRENTPRKWLEIAAGTPAVGMGRAGTLLSATQWPCESGQRWHMSSGKQQARRTLGGVPRGGLGAVYEPDSCCHSPVLGAAAEPQPQGEGSSGRAHGTSGSPAGQAFVLSHFTREETGSIDQGAGPRRTAGPRWRFSLGPPS